MRMDGEAGRERRKRREHVFVGSGAFWAGKDGVREAKHTQF
jgi:hypothetical protein